MATDSVIVALQSRFGREKLIKRFKVQQKVKKTAKGSSPSKDVTMSEKAQYASFKHIFI